MLHEGLAGGEVDARRDDAGHRAERLLDARDAGGAGHAVDGEAAGLDGDRIAGLGDGGDDGRDVGVAAGEGDPRPLGREIDVGRRDTGGAGDGPLDAPHAGGAGHALDGQENRRALRGDGAGRAGLVG